MNPLPDSDSAPQESSPPRILAVDDSLSALTYVQGVLESDGFHVSTALGGMEGLAAASSSCFDLIILDVLMPDLDGLELCRRLRAQETTRSTPILFLTSDERPSTQMEAIRAGGDDLLYKPSLNRELVIRARSLLRLESLQNLVKRDRDTLLRLQHQREKLFSFIVHDLKSPLQVIQANSDLVLYGLAAGKDPAPRIAIIQETVKRMTRMVQDLLDVTLSEHGAVPLAPRFTDLVGLLRDCQAEIQPALDRAEVKLEIHGAECLEANADPDLIRRCLLNLLDNALKYGPRGGTIRMGAEAKGMTARIEVRDEGPGVPPGMREQIFDPFVRLERDSAQARVSSGLGLAFCRTVIQAHHGDIWVEAAEPHGSTFVFELPISGK